LFARIWLPVLKTIPLIGLSYLVYSLITSLPKRDLLDISRDFITPLGYTILYTILILETIFLIFTRYKRRQLHRFQLPAIAGRARSQVRQKIYNVLDTTPLAIMIVDSELNVSYVNDAWQNMVGYTAEEVVGKSLTDLFKILLKENNTGLHNLKDNVSLPLHREVEIISKNGTAIHAVLEAKPLIPGNIREGIVIYFQDIKVRVNYEQLKLIFDTILHQMVGGVIVVDSTGKIQIANQEIKRLTGQEQEDLTGKFIWEIFPDMDKNKLVTMVALQKGQAVGPLELCYKINNKNFHLLIRSDVLRDRHGRISGAVTVIQDVTEIHRQQELQNNQEKLAVVGQMAAGMAHELRNPLTSIKGFAQILSERVKDAKNKEFLDVIIQEVNRTNEIISDFLVLARPHPARREEEVNLNLLIHELLPLVESQCLLAQVKLILDLAPELPSIKAQPDQIKQVLLNLIHNALQAMERQPVRNLTIISRWSAGTSEVLVVVRDTGLGMSDEILSRLSTPFFTTKDAGTGMGLTISYRIIENHGGRIEVSSQEGAGSEFRIYLPARDPGQIH
jgi:PAS domain S-box-containing protein